MNLTTNEIIVIAVAVVAVLLIIAAIVMFVRKRRRRDELKQRYGRDEYARTVDRAGSEKRAERQLTERESRRERFELRDLSSGERASFRGRFEAIEASFLDDPTLAVRRADELLDEVAEARGYPDGTADERLEDLSTEHAPEVERYRSSRTEPDHEGRSATTEQHRQAMLGSRALFDAIVGRSAEPSADPSSAFGRIIELDEGQPEHAGNGTGRSRSGGR